MDFGIKMLNLDAILMNFVVVLMVLENFLKKSSSENLFKILKSGPENPKP